MSLDLTARPLPLTRGMDDVPRLRPLPDRRGADRLELPRCRVCAMSNSVVVHRAPTMIYSRCPDCGDVRPIAKPLRDLPLRAAGE